MHVWLITIGEPLPTDGPNERLLRTGILAEMLVKLGHEVVWWTSAFDHVRKKHRACQTTTLQVTNDYQLILLYSRGYAINISLKRLLDHRDHTRGFNTVASGKPKPDVILCSMPSIELSLASVQFATAHKIPIVLDIRDLWPDIFVDRASPSARSLARLLLQPLFRDLSWACKHATAITGITEPIVSWGLKYAARSRTTLDRAFPFGYVEKMPSPEELARSHVFWKEHGIGDGSQEFIVCFFGTIGYQFDLDTVIDAARKLDKSSRNIRFIVCGTGDRLKYYQKRAANLSNILFPGWVGASDIWVLMRSARLGLAPYHNTKDFCSSLPNKSIEYLSAGLPVVYCLNGVLHELLENNDCGVKYVEGDADSLVDVLEGVCDSKDRLNEMAKKSFELYQTKFTAERVYTDMTQYLEVLAGQGSSSHHRREDAH